MYRFAMLVSVLLLVSPVLADHFDSGSDGTDGALNCETLGLTDCANTCTEKTPCEVQILLGSATTASWDTPSPDQGAGVYDADEWAVVYKYTTIDIPAFVTVTFGNHYSGAPVMWLASEDVTIAGSVRVDGEDAPASGGSGFAVPGPGGFGGGIGLLGRSAGFGPGGGFDVGSVGGGGGYGSPGLGDGGGVAYGKDSLAPLIGGSGGSARSSSNLPGGAGGGAILIASSGNITLDSTGGIFANGGETLSSLSGNGSGGGIRLIAHAVSGSGILRALGGTFGTNDGGAGRIRIDGGSGSIDSEPPISRGPVGPIFPQSPARLRATTVGGNAVPIDPQGTVFSGDVGFTAEGPVEIGIEALNVPVGLIVTVRIVQKDGSNSFVIFSTPLEGTFELSNATATAAESEFLPPGPYEVYLSLQLP